MDNNQLQVTIDLEDYDAGLTGKLTANGFSGFGEGWFNLSDIKQFADELEELALNVTGKTELVAGQSKADGSEYLERFGLRCYVVARTGIIGVHVLLTDYPYTDCRKEEISTVSGEIKAEVQSVIEFCSQLRSLCSGINREALLVGRQ
jgi:hypothetical protein